MDVEVMIVIGLMILFAVMIDVAARIIERRWRVNHPPNGWDGCREDDAHDCRN